MGTMNEFILYVLGTKELNTTEIYNEINRIPCKKPWSNDAKTPTATCSAACTRMYQKNILDRENIDGIYIYWII